MYYTIVLCNTLVAKKYHSLKTSLNVQQYHDL